MFMRIILCFVLLLFSCGRPPSKVEQWVVPNGKPKVLSTTAIIDDLVGQIGGQRIDHIALIEGAIDPHSYELVKGDDEKLSFAQVVFYNGLGLEHGASLKHQLDRHPKAIPLGEKIRENHQEAILYDHGQVDPHVWLDISLWCETIDPIVEALSSLDPESKPYFEAQGRRMKEELLQLDQQLAERIHQIPSEKRYLVTSHDAFNYFTRRYLHTGDTTWKDRFCAPEGLAPDGQLSSFDIQQVISHLEKHQIEVIFPESNVSRDSLKKIVSVCSEKGMKITIFQEPLYADALGPSSENYQQMMEHNINALCKAWQGSE